LNKLKRILARMSSDAAAKFNANHGSGWRSVAPFTAQVDGSDASPSRFKPVFASKSLMVVDPSTMTSA